MSGGEQLGVLRRHRQRRAGIRPLEGMSKVGVPGGAEAMNEVPQGLGGGDIGPAQALAAQDRAPNLHLIEPRALGRQPVKRNLRAVGGAPVQHGLFLMIAGIIHNQRPATVGVAGAQRTQEVTKLQIGMALRAVREDLPGSYSKSSKEIEGARAEILKLLALDQARPQGQRGRQPLQGLEVGLLSEAEHATPARGMQIEGENLGPRLLKQGVGAGQEVTQAMGLEHQCRQNPLDRGRAHGQNLAAPSDQAGHIPDAVMRKAPNRPFLTALTGDGDDRVARQGGKKPVGAPPGATPAGQLARPGSASSSAITGGGSDSAKRLRHFCPNLRSEPSCVYRPYQFSLSTNLSLTPSAAFLSPVSPWYQTLR